MGSRHAYRLGGLAAALTLALAGPAFAQQVSAGKGEPDEAAHIQRIANNKKRHYACAVSTATRDAMASRKASTDTVAAGALRGCREFELEYTKLLKNGVPMTDGHVAAASAKVVAQLIEMRRRELRPSILGATKEVR